ncbi:ATP-dependent helicase HrpB [Actinophytocola algeriensis]|uniref:ATP-dependent helicase HrpB n=1 Tax=Actinophytocola algeriensis TaxID=1768010 RepID=A0A7W7VCY8_9PSEU|nr:ATP-dependent helicase HrpB [Actinophytocola algeriensis]MBB4905577.1 ATP-dependent helicase HrpB [Actinophytocola algeriensis]MBE1472738.1 ATP-dependent helicase HrpB [Actinophytocola algeriensis]
MLPAHLPDLPIRAVLDDVTDALDRHGTAVLVAPPGTGKTTVLPLALTGKVVVAEPRRLAARAAATRMAQLIDEPVGRTVGYAVRGDRKTSKDTRIEVVTTGLLVRRLQHDPALDGVDTVLLDEIHERHLDADLLLTLLLDARAGLRPDLRLLATSATVATDRIATLLGDGTPVIEAHVRTYPVTTTYTPPARRERIEQLVARTVHTALSEQDGDVLVFLPGAAEINRVTGLLSGVRTVPLHGRLPAAKQDAALTPGTARRVVLATAVAESSLTVPGVRAVVDSGLARVPRMDHRRGLAGLVTTRVSVSVAEQRAGRAGREAPGRVYRCWAEHEHATLPAQPEPEIRTADLTRLALELACWGTPDGSALDWWDPPPAGALAAGRAVLTALGALGADGAVTGRGRRIADVGLHPRLARALLDGAEAVGATAAAEVVALLDDDTLATGTSVEDTLRRLRRDGDRRWAREVRRLAALVPKGRPGTPDPALVVALAHPERLARRRAPGSHVYLMAGGTAAELDGSADAEWLAVASADRQPGRTQGKIRLAARADQALAERAAPALLSEVDEIGWADGDVVARHVRRLGAIVLRARPLPDPDPERVRAALVDGLRAEGLDLLRWHESATRLRQRLALLHRALGDPWPAVDDDALLRAAPVWLGPELATARRRADLAKVDTHGALQRLLPWPAAGRLDELAPDRIQVPSGARVRVDYSADDPVLPVKLQETFGWLDTPAVADGRVPVLLHLLSPAGRPVAITRDLATFWREGYRQVRAELRGRYPKHPWPEDPATAAPTARLNRRA